LEDIFSFTEVETLVNLLHTQVKTHRDKLNKEGVEWMENLKNSFLKDKAIGLQFLRQVADLMRQESVIENNETLQKRINAAAGHFEPKFAACQHSIQNHPLVTEHREVATVINETLLQLLLSVHTANYFLEYCKQPFSVTTFLQHKLKFAQPRLNISCYASSKKQSYTDVPNPELYDTLKRWRDMVCEDTKMPIYMVANQATLKEIATYLPMAKKDLLQISGFGKVKVDKYGEDILEFVEDYCSRNNIESNMAAKEIIPKKKERGEKSNEVKTDTKTLSFNLFRDGKSIAEIAKERNYTIGTIEGHLAWFVGNGDINISEIVPEKKQLLIKEAIKTYGSLSHKTLIENLPSDFTYGEIRLVMASEKAASQV
jgi:hypothetical protein